MSDLAPKPTPHNTVAAVRNLRLPWTQTLLPRNLLRPIWVQLGPIG